MPYSGPSHELGAMHCVRAELNDGVLTITLDRPMQRNAINVAMSHEMESLLNAVNVDTAVRTVVLRGAGEGFCAGLETADFHDTDRGSEAQLRVARESADQWRVRRLRLLPQPVIAMVHGFCEGGAIAILESCDIVLAAEDARFVLTDDGADTFPAGPTTKAMSRVMTARAANYYALTGEAFDGPEAERNGLVTRSLPAAELEAEVYALASGFVAKDPTAVQFTKETLLHAGSMSWDGALNFTAAKLAELKSLQAGRPSTRAAAVQSFLSGKSKPGLGA